MQNVYFLPEIERSQQAGRKCVQSRPLTLELGGLLRAFDCFVYFFKGYVGMVTTTFGAQQLAALVALLNYDHIPLRYRFICDFFFSFCCGRGILSETFDFLDCANYSVFF